MSTFLIGLREGVEASLIVGILAAFLVKQGRRESLRYLWLGVGAAIALCLAVGVGLDVVNEELPERQQEILETGVAAVAVGFVTYMIVWMKRNSQGLRRHLEHRADAALVAGSAAGIVIMAFLAVLREGFETAVFLTAVVQTSTNTFGAVLGAFLGLGVAIAIGVAITKGGARLDMAKFFRITSVLLVMVAAGLLASATHSAHEIGLVGGGQSEFVNLSWLVAPDSIRGSLLTAMFGLQPRPVVAEALAWALYAIPVLAYVLWPTASRVTNIVAEAPRTASHA